VSSDHGTAYTYTAGVYVYLIMRSHPGLEDALCVEDALFPGPLCCHEQLQARLSLSFYVESDVSDFGIQGDSPLNTSLSLFLSLSRFRSLFLSLYLSLSLFPSLSTSLSLAFSLLSPFLCGRNVVHHTSEIEGIS